MTAALGAALLTSLGSLGVMWLREWRRGRASDRDTLCKAVVDMLTRSLGVSLRAAAMRTTIRFRSGLSEGVDVTFGLRKPADALELYDWQAQDLTPLNAALSEIWTRWDQEGVRLANDLVQKCMDLSDASIALAPAGTIRQRVRKHVVGERWTPEMEEAYDRAVKAMAHARKRLADYARDKLGLPAVDLFAQVESPADRDAVTSGPDRAAQNGQKALPTGGRPSAGASG